MTDNSRKKFIIALLVSGSIAILLYVVGVAINPDRTLNIWKLAGAGVGGAGMIAIVIFSIINKKKEEKK